MNNATEYMQKHDYKHFIKIKQKCKGRESLEKKSKEKHSIVNIDGVDVMYLNIKDTKAT